MWTGPETRLSAPDAAVDVLALGDGQVAVPPTYHLRCRALYASLHRPPLLLPMEILPREGHPPQQVLSNEASSLSVRIIPVQRADNYGAVALYLLGHVALHV
jgi:hypothetical protein